jgi:hypothetical protein
MGSDVCEVQAMLDEMAGGIAEAKERGLSLEMPIEVRASIATAASSRSTRSPTK